VSRTKKNAPAAPPPGAPPVALPPARSGVPSPVLMTGALVLCVPVVLLLLQDNLTVRGAAVRFLVALVVSWLGLSVVRAAARGPEPEPDEDDGAGTDAPSDAPTAGRRDEDPVPAAEPPAP